MKVQLSNTTSTLSFKPVNHKRGACLRPPLTITLGPLTNSVLHTRAPPQQVSNGSKISVITKKHRNRVFSLRDLSTIINLTSCLTLSWCWTDSSHRGWTLIFQTLMLSTPSQPSTGPIKTICALISHHKLLISFSTFSQLWDSSNATRTWSILSMTSVNSLNGIPKPQTSHSPHTLNSSMSAHYLTRTLSLSSNTSHSPQVKIFTAETWSDGSEMDHLQWIKTATQRIWSGWSTFLRWEFKVKVLVTMLLTTLLLQRQSMLKSPPIE